MSKQIKDLYLDNQFDTIINTVKDSKDPEDIYFKIESLTETLKTKEAYDLLMKNRELVEKWDIKSISYLLFVILIRLKASDKVIESEINYYIDYPYISQDIEEYMHDLRETVQSIKNREVKQKESVYLDDVYSIPVDMNSGDKRKISIAIGKMIDLHKKGLDFENIAVQYANKHEQYDINYAFLLYYLTTINSKNIISFKKADKYFTVKPCNLHDYIEKTNPLIDAKFKDFSQTEKNINVISFVKSFYGLFFLYLLPYKISLGELDTFFEVLIRFGYQTYMLDETEDNYLKSLRHNERIYDYFNENACRLFDEISTL